MVLSASSIGFSSSSKKKKMYIAGIKSEVAKKPLLDRIRNGITLSVLDNYGSTYQVLDDEAVRVMYAQAEKILSSGCDDTSCITQIADGINADEIIFGEVYYDGVKIKLVIKSLERKNMELQTKSMVSVSFTEKQTDWFAAETAKKLVEPKYKIDVAKAPVEFDSRIEIKGIETGEIKGIGIKDVKGFDIEVMKFNTSDDAAQKILGYLKEMIQKGDDYYTGKGYKDALEKYHLVIERIESKLRPESAKKIESFKKEVVKRIETTYRMFFKVEIEKSDVEFRDGDYDDALAGYYSVNKGINAVPGRYKESLDDISSEVDKRIESAYAMKYKSAVDKYDAELKANAAASETLINKIIGNYNEIKKEMKDLIPRSYYGSHVIGVEKAIDERIDSCYIMISNLHEKLGDTAYSEYRFDKAVDQYKKSFESASLVKGKLKKSATGRYNTKISAAIKTGRSYFQNKMKLYSDLVEFYNVRDETWKAGSTLDEAFKYMTGEMSIFVTVSAIDTYNGVAELLKRDLIILDGRIYPDDDKRNLKKEKDFEVFKKATGAEPFLGKFRERYDECYTRYYRNCVDSSNGKLFGCREIIGYIDNNTYGLAAAGVANSKAEKDLKMKTALAGAIINGIFQIYEKSSGSPVETYDRKKGINIKKFDGVFYNIKISANIHSANIHDEGIVEYYNEIVKFTLPDGSVVGINNFELTDESIDNIDNFFGYLQNLPILGIKEIYDKEYNCEVKIFFVEDNLSQ
jgi:tetratricopeptide (TPR) repeat protein